MKKTIAFVFTVILLVSVLCGCNDKENTYGSAFNYKTDYQYYYNTLGGCTLPITKSETGYYFFLQNRFLYYLDKESMQATPLCNKVNCLHNDRDECSAYFNTFQVPSTIAGANIVQYYEDSLYMLLREEDQYGALLSNSLYKVSLDGTTREHLITFEDYANNWIIHRGYLYFSQVKYSDEIKDFTTYDSVSIKRLPINDLESEPMEIFNTKNYYESVYGDYPFTAYGDYLLLVVRPISSEDIKTYEQTQELNAIPFDYFYSINTQTLKIHQINTEEKEMSAPVFYNDKLLYTIIDGDDRKSRYYTSDLDGNNEMFFKDMEYGDFISPNGEQIYLYNTRRAFEGGNVNDEISMLDSDFEVESTFKMPFKHMFVNIPQDPESFILIMQTSNTTEEVYYIDKSKLNNLNGEEAEYKVVYSESQ